MSDTIYLVDEMRAIVAGDTSEQEKTIARVVLAGWRLVPQGSDLTPTRYQVIGPDGRWYGSASTRYTAACKAEVLIWEGERIVALMPEGER